MPPCSQMRTRTGTFSLKICAMFEKRKKTSQLLSRSKNSPEPKRKNGKAPRDFSDSFKASRMRKRGALCRAPARRSGDLHPAGVPRSALNKTYATKNSAKTPPSKKFIPLPGTATLPPRGNTIRQQGHVQAITMHGALNDERLLKKEPF